MVVRKLLSIQCLLNIILKHSKSKIDVYWSNSIEIGTIRNQEQSITSFCTFGKNPLSTSEDIAIRICTLSEMLKDDCLLNTFMDRLELTFRDQ